MKRKNQLREVNVKPVPSKCLYLYLLPEFSHELIFRAFKFEESKVYLKTEQGFKFFA